MGQKYIIESSEEFKTVGALPFSFFMVESSVHLGYVMGAKEKWGRSEGIGFFSKMSLSC